MLLLLTLLQSAAPTSLPDIELNIQATARSVKVEQKGEASLEVRSEPNGGNVAWAEVDPPANGARERRGVIVDVHAEARIADPQQNRAEAETDQPNRR